MAFEAEVRIKRRAAETARLVAQWASDCQAREIILKRAADLDAVAASLQGRPEKSETAAHTALSVSTDSLA